MSIAQTPKVTQQRVLFRHEWRSLFPAAWVDQAFVAESRRKRLDELREGQLRVAENYHLQIWFITGTAICLMVLFQIWTPVKELFSDLLPILWLLPLIVAANLVAAAVKFVQTECERTLLQIIDRIENEKSNQ